MKKVKFVSRLSCFRSEGDNKLLHINSCRFCCSLPSLWQPMSPRTLYCLTNIFLTKMLISSLFLSLYKDAGFLILLLQHHHLELFANLCWLVRENPKWACEPYLLSFQLKKDFIKLYKAVPVVSIVEFSKLYKSSTSVFFIHLVSFAESSFVVQT